MPNYLNRLLTPLNASLSVLIVIGLVVAYVLFALPPTNLVISTGGTEGAYYAFGLEYADHLATNRVEATVLPGAGSIETLARLQAGTADAGFVQTGTTTAIDSLDGLTTLGSLFYEPIWVFHRADVTVDVLSDLRGRRIAVGVEGSGTRLVANQLLALNDIDDTNTDLLPLPFGEAADAIEAGEIDALFVIVSPRAAAVRNLLVVPEVELLSFRRVAAYNSRFPYMTSVTIGEGVIDFSENVPVEDKTLLAVTATMVVREGLHPGLVRLLAREAQIIHSGGGLLESVNEFPNLLYAELPANSHAVNIYEDGPSWFERNFPFRLAVLLDRLLVVGLPLLTVYTLYRAISPLYRFHIRYQTTHWYTILAEIEARLGSMTLDEILVEQKRLRDLLDDLTHRVSLPFMYMNGIYILKSHVNLVMERLEQKRNELETTTRTSLS